MAWCAVRKAWEALCAATRAKVAHWEAAVAEEQAALLKLRKRLRIRSASEPTPQPEWDAEIKPIHDRFHAETPVFDVTVKQYKHELLEAIDACPSAEWPRGGLREVARHHCSTYRSMGEQYAHERAAAEVLLWKALGFNADVEDHDEVHYTAGLPPYHDKWSVVVADVDVEPELAAMLITKLDFREWLVMIWDAMPACNTKCIFGYWATNRWDPEAASIRASAAAMKKRREA